jgi:hypothetical protein
MQLSAGAELVVMWDDGPEDSLTLLQHGLQRALVSLGVPAVHRARTGAVRFVARVLGKSGLIRPMLPRGRRQSLTVLSWASDARTFPDSYWREPVPWIFDCWQPQFRQWERLLRRHRVRTAFFSARAAAQHFAARVPGLRTYWVPEACDPERYSWCRPLALRSRGVLELGRRWSWLHERIRDPLQRAGVSHLYSDESGGKALFADVATLYEGLGDTAVMLCFPRSITHPAAAGGVETLTQRYLEAIGSGCLVVGHAPQELVDLFGFDPVVHLNARDPAGHLLAVLGDLASHQGLVERARQRLREVGTFECRARTIVAALRQGQCEEQPALGP